MSKDFIDKFKRTILDNGKKHWQLILVSVVIGFIVSSIFFGNRSKTMSPQDQHKSTKSQSEKKIRYWTCSMHPQIKLPKSGKCPICGMTLIPIYEEGGTVDEEGTVSLTLSETGYKLAEIETTEVKYQEASTQVRLVGKVDYDETRLSYISAWVAGRIDRLYVDFTGTKVRKGDHLIKLYSPELLATQEEYIQAIKNLEESKKSSLSVIRDTSRATLNSAKEKLRLYGIDEKQIQEIAKRGKPQEHMTITSPVTGTVIHKNGFEGMYVKTGDKIYTIADLSRVWLYLDAYESDIQWLHYGQSVSVEAESYPGKIFQGKVAFIDPFVNEKTRTIKLRVNVDNKDEKLKPGMFVRATIKAVMGEGGKIYDQDLAGKWICPMHPDVIKNDQGTCDICGMQLVKTSEFGFSDKPVLQKKVLVIPKTAPLITGKRAVVYIEKTGDKSGRHRYEGREVLLGPRAGDMYIVLSGLKEGDMVVSKGNFKIDSALQIQAKPSMMNPAGFYNEEENIFSQGVSSDKQSASVLISALPYYLQASSALAQDNASGGVNNLRKFKDEINKIIRKDLLREEKKGIALEIDLLRQKLTPTISGDLDYLRDLFAGISGILKEIFQKYEYREDLKLYLSFCPMAFGGKGAYWLQDSKDIKNPYLGVKMLKCGEIKKEYGRKIKETKPMTGHAGH